MSHGEGLSGKHAVQKYGGEQLVLFHCRKQEGDGMGLHTQLDCHIIPMNIIDLSAMLLLIMVQEVLQGTYRKVSAGAA